MAQESAVQFVLTGFTQEKDFRVFQFDCVVSKQQRTEFTVRADLGSIRGYGIQVQDLPLLCRGVLEDRDVSEEGRAFTLTEERMSKYAKERAVAKELAAQRKVPVRKQKAETLGNAWRGPQRW